MDIEKLDISQYKRYICEALEYSGGTHTFEDICEGVAAGTLQFWPGRASAVITEVVQTPRQKILHFFLAGGNLADMERMLPGLREWGREQGCTKMTLTGRKGWERTFLAREGWKPTLVVYEATLDV